MSSPEEATGGARYRLCGFRGGGGAVADFYIVPRRASSSVLRRGRIMVIYAGMAGLLGRETGGNKMGDFLTNRGVLKLVKKCTKNTNFRFCRVRHIVAE